ncbi:hypothetical protein [Streptomyces sp. NPDC102283]|uniref:hypothetical protein n=1 Tax=Streptomyces sp. NPDC102283 TaxID=3366155 RepID=UPI003800DDB1
MGQDRLGARPGDRRITRATHWAGLLLCWAHVIAMALTAAEAVLRPTAGWWVVSWMVTAALFIAWVLLRTAEKRLLCQAAGTEDEEPDCPFPEAPTHYDRAA